MKIIYKILYIEKIHFEISKIILNTESTCNDKTYLKFIMKDIFLLMTDNFSILIFSNINKIYQRNRLAKFYPRSKSVCINRKTQNLITQIKITPHK